MIVLILIFVLRSFFQILCRFLRVKNGNESADITYSLSTYKFGLFVLRFMCKIYEYYDNTRIFVFFKYKNYILSLHLSVHFKNIAFFIH